MGIQAIEVIESWPASFGWLVGFSRRRVDGRNADRRADQLVEPHRRDGLECLRVRESHLRRVLRLERLEDHQRIDATQLRDAPDISVLRIGTRQPQVLTMNWRAGSLELP